MVNGSWSNKNQFPSAVFPQPMESDVASDVAQETEKDTSVASESSPNQSEALPSFLSVDGNGTGGLMQRARGTGGANPTLMVPSDVNPRGRSVTPIDSGKDAKLSQSTTPSTVSSYAELSALTRTEDSPTVPQENSQSTATERRLAPFEGNMDENIHRPNDLASAASPPVSIKVRKFRGDESDMDANLKGFSKSGKPLDRNHHINIDGQQASNSGMAQRAQDQQHPQQEPALPSTRLVPFNGSSLMEEATKKPTDHAIPQTTKLVKFDGQSLMEQERQLQIKQETEVRSKIIQQFHQRLVPYSKAQDEVPESKSGSAAAPSDSTESEEVPSGKVVLYNKKAAVASSVVQSPKREYYYIQYRPPTDSTMARKTGLQANTPISLWAERDKFLDY
ncbi:MAG: hypothetical protein SGILL_008554 [Bacillariaceae sp.]